MLGYLSLVQQCKFLNWNRFFYKAHAGVFVQAGQSRPREHFQKACQESKVHQAEPYVRRHEAGDTANAIACMVT